MAKAPASTLACKGAILSLMQGASIYQHKLLQELGETFTRKCIFDSLSDLLTEGRITETLVIGEGSRFDPVSPADTVPKGFSYRHITPLFAGTPEWIVEGLDPQNNPKLLAWCPREFDAALITAALNGERS